MMKVVGAVVLTALVGEGFHVAWNRGYSRGYEVAQRTIPPQVQYVEMPTPVPMLCPEQPYEPIQLINPYDLLPDAHHSRRNRR
jgi:hypothetical protein